MRELLLAKLLDFGAPEWRRPMKKLLAAGALVALIASPALARDMQHQQAAGYRADTNDGPRGEVIRQGQLVGQDPDPFIREQLGREWGNDGN